MNVVGYIREPSNPETADSTYAQSERIRRWVARNGYHLVALCQDSPGARSGFDGFHTVIGIAARKQADLVLLPGLAALSPDKVIQELLLNALRSYGLAVASTETSDHEALAEPAVDPARMLIRDVLHRIEEYADLLSPTRDDLALPQESVVHIEQAYEPAVLIEFEEVAANAS